MKKEITIGVTRIILVMTLAMLLVPYVGDVVTEYLNQIGLLYGILLYVGVIVTSFILYLLLRKLSFLKKFDTDNTLANATEQSMLILVLTVITIPMLKITSPFWVCIGLIGIESYSIFCKVLEKHEAL